jgi:hypothetical protein
MKSLNYVFACLLFIGSAYTVQAQDNQPTNETQEISNEKIEVYYFHNTRRCATCQAIESVTKSSLEELYPEQFKKGEVTFVSLNIEDDANEDLVNDLKISGQTLLIVKDGKKKDLTNDAFMYARSNPEKLKDKIQKAIGTI